MIYTDFEYLDEVYFGKTQEINKVYKQFSLARRRIIESNSKNKLIGSSADELIKFNKDIENLFGFYSYSLNIKYTQEITAYTIPFSVQFDTWNIDKHFTPGRNGFKFDKSDKINIVTVISSKLFLDERYSDREMFAILLHEIGHNFQTVLNRNSFIFNNILKVLDLVNAIILFVLRYPGSFINLVLKSSVGTRLANKLNKFINTKCKNVAILINSLQNLFSILFNIIGMTLSVVHPLKYLLSALKHVIANYNPVSLIVNMLKYNDEKIADDFAVLYGFGDELSSALEKLTYAKTYKSDFLSTIAELLAFPVTILVTPVDEYPGLIIRLEEMIKYLKKDLINNSYNPNTIKEINNTINEIQKKIDKLKNPNYTPDEITAIRKGFDLFCYSHFHGGIKELINKSADNSTSIDKSYKAALSKPKII